MTPRPAPAGLREMLDRSRWFANKGQDYSLGTIEIAARMRQSPLVELWLVPVTVAGAVTTYHLVVEHRDSADERHAHALIGVDGGEWLYDALHERSLTTDWTDLLAGRLTAPGLTGHRVGTLPLPLGETGRALTVEQSNTSLVYGSELILKVFRRAQPGPNPDVEVHEALAAAGSPHVAQPYGHIEGPGGVLAFAQEFLSGGAEGWELATTSVRDLLRNGDLHAELAGGDFAAEAERLGVVTAEVHADLRTTLPTQEWDPDALRERIGIMRQRLEVAVAAAPELLPSRPGLVALYDEAEATRTPLVAQRVHGDLHLGQTMRVASGWRILDFEGEPAAPVEERRRLDLALRDVAGMLRSFDYAAHHPLMIEGAVSPMTPRALEWVIRNREAFCLGYAEASGTDPRASGALLRAFEADKAVYEVVYEARMRPTWVTIPLTAVETLAG